MVLIEQPELHLHPEAQGRLADVLVGLARQRRTGLVIETHSEHILLRLLRRVAEGEWVNPSDLAVVVVDGGDVLSLGVNELGQLTGGTLPEGFFEEDWQDSLALAQAAAERAADQ